SAPHIKGNAVRTAPVTAHAPTAALFQPERGIVPYPTDLYFSGSPDGTLTNSVGTLDGFSTTAVIRARFGGALDPASLTAQSIVVLQVAIDNSSKTTTRIVRPLVFGVDFTAGAGVEPGVGTSTLEIRPTRPLVPSTGST